MITIYTLSSTRDLNDIKYVGKTVQSLKRRLSQHINDAKRALRQKYFGNKDGNGINKEISDGYVIKIEYLDELDILDKDNGEGLETYGISQLKVGGFNLNNMTNGGDGNKKQQFNLETNLKRSFKLKGRKRTKEECEAISKGKLGIKLTNSHKENVRKAIIALQGKSIKQYDKNGNFIKEGSYVKEAADFYNTNGGNIIKCCKRDKNHTTCVGYIGRYSDDSLPVLNGIVIKKLLQLDLNGNLIKVGNTASKAAKELNLSPSLISNCCNGKIDNYKGFIWKFNR